MKYRLPLVVVLLIFLLVNIAFNINIWSEIIQFQQIEIIEKGDGAVFEALTEEVYQRLISFKNPFFIQRILFPFETNISLTDPASFFAILFVPLRLIFATHQSMMIILMLNLFLAEIGMYVLLRKYNISPVIALIFSLIYAFTPFVAIRISGHYTYTTIYFFPWLFFVIRKFLVEEKRLQKFILSMALSGLLAILLLTNFYFFIMSFMIFSLYLVFFMLKDTKKTMQIIIAESKYLIFSILLFFILLSPWLYAVYQYIFFDDVVKTPGFGGAIELSADLLSFITPSESNPIYRYIIVSLASVIPVLSKYKNFYISYGMHFAYPGIIILLTYFYLLIFWRKIKKIQKTQILPHLMISIFFAILLLGPFLKIANRWQLTLDGVSVVLPLPFLILHYIPGLNMMRDPPRLLPVFVFLSSIVSSIVVNKWFLKAKAKKFITIGLVLVFFLDQYYINSVKIIQRIPVKLFKTIERDKSNYSVLGIPFTLRDGFNYMGFVHENMNIYGTVVHNRPVIGGYGARVSPDVFLYYKNLPFISYVAETVDKGNYNPYNELPTNKNMHPFEGSKREIADEIEFFNIKYIVLKNDETYSKQMTKFLNDIGYKKIFRDGQYDLLKVKLTNKSYNHVNLGAALDYLFVVSGLSDKIKNEYRIVTDDVVKIVLKPKNTKAVFLNAETNKVLKMSLYINKNEAGELNLIPGKKSYSIKISNDFKKDNINELILKLDKQMIENGAIVKLYSLSFK